MSKKIPGNEEKGYKKQSGGFHYDPIRFTGAYAQMIDLKVFGNNWDIIRQLPILNSPKKNPSLTKTPLITHNKGNDNMIIKKKEQ